MRSQRRFVRGVSSLAGGAAFGQLLVALSAPAMARLYAPEAFGAAAVFVSTTSVIALVSTLRLELGVPLQENDSEARRLSATACALTLVFAAVFGITILLTPAQGLNRLGLGVLVELSALAVLSVLLQGFLQVLQSVAIREREYSRSAVSSAVQYGLQVAVQLVLGASTRTPNGIVVGIVAGQFIACFVLLMHVAPRVRGSIRSSAGIRETLRRHWAYPAIYTPSALLNALSLQGPVLVFSLFYGAQSLGQYSLAFRVLAAPVAVVVSAVGRVFLGEIGRIGASDPARLLIAFRGSAKSLAILAGIGALLVVSVGPSVFVILFGAEWKVAGEIACVIIPMLASQLVVSPLTQVANVLGLHRVQLISDSLRFASAVLAPSALALAGISFEYVVVTLSAAMTAQYVMLYFFLNRAIVQRSGLSKLVTND